MDILSEHVSAFFGGTTRIIRDGTGAYTYHARKRADANCELGTYHNGKACKACKVNYSRSTLARRMGIR